jgi:[ribosomal protein S18]-alanine N-acetyltransferase
MTEADLPRVVMIDRSSFSLPWPERSFTFEIKENENSIPLVAEWTKPDGQIDLAGFIVTWVIVDEAHVGSVAVAEDCRQHGVGELLVRQSLRMARERGCLQGYLEVRRGNTAAIHLYEKLGYIVDAIRPRYYEDNHEDALLMSLASLAEI